MTRVSADLQKFQLARALLSSERQIASPIATFEQGLFEREREVSGVPTPLSHDT